MVGVPVCPGKRVCHVATWLLKRGIAKRQVTGVAEVGPIAICRGWFEGFAGSKASERWDTAYLLRISQTGSVNDPYGISYCGILNDRVATRNGGLAVQAGSVKDQLRRRPADACNRAYTACFRCRPTQAIVKIGTRTPMHFQRAPPHGERA